MSEHPFTKADAVAETDLLAPRLRRGWELVVALTSGRQEHALQAPCEIIVGRGEGSNIVVDHGSVSRRHARIVLREDATLEDLGSSNGTRLDGRLLERGQRESVRTGSVIELGDVVILLRPPETETDAGRHGAGVGVEMARAHDLAAAAAKSSLHVYVSGEQGAGKSWLVERIHRASPRSGAPLVRLRNDGAGEDALLGAVGQAKGGIVHLQAPERMTKAAQALLESELATRRLDVRVITTSTMSPRELASDGFDAGLAARLLGVTIEVPPLRLRRGEIRRLAEAALLEAPRSGLRLNDDTLGRLLLHDWPGNVAQLRQVVLRAASVARTGDIRLEDILFTDDPPDAPHTAEVKERARVLLALELCAGNQSKAAQMLGISRRTLVNRLDQLALPRPRKPPCPRRRRAA